MAQHKLELDDAQSIGANPIYSVFLDASAGTGKTKVLCDRFLNLVLAGADPTKILCVTFTNSAASEMLERITLNAKRWSHMTEAEMLAEFGPLSAIEIERVRGAYHSIVFGKYNLKVKTLHAFCLEILMRYRERLTGKPRRILEYATKQRLLKAAFSMASNDTTSALLRLSAHIALSEITSRVHDAITKRFEFAAYIATWTATLSTHIYELHQANPQFNYVQAQQEVIHSIDAGAIAALQMVLSTDARAAPILESIRSSNYTRLRDLVLTKACTPRSLFASKKAMHASPECLAALNDIQNAIIAVEKSYSAYMCASLNEAFITLAASVFEHYRAFKASGGYMDYDDIIAESMALLREDPGILYNLDYKIEHILVDEAQDLSDEQWQLIELLSSEFFAGVGAQDKARTLFIVGDFKQSIFSFQGAKPVLFKAAASAFHQRAQHTGLWRNAAMSKSFRSSHRVLELVNAVFGDIFDGFLEHYPHKLEEGHVEVWPLIQKPQKEELEGWQLPKAEWCTNDTVSELANMIAGRIDGWIKDGRILSNGKRIRGGDIMVLVRKRSALIAELQRCLHSRGIAVSTPTGLFVDEIVIMDLMSVVNFMISPQDDLNLAGLLKSPFFGITDAELLELCKHRGGSLFDALLKKRPDIHAILTEIREMFVTNSLSGAFYKLLMHNGYYDRFIQQMGGMVQSNLDNFLQAVIDFEASGMVGGFKALLEYLRFYTPKKATLGNDQDTVQVMTVHSAKGLQAPIVIIADAASSENSPHASSFYHEGELYFGVGSAYKSAALSEAQGAIKEAAQQESKRLLYVALTRAESEVYIAGMQNSKDADSWYAAVADSL